jgi:hypothetical protein
MEMECVYCEVSSHKHQEANIVQDNPQNDFVRGLADIQTAVSCLAL